MCTYVDIIIKYTGDLVIKKDCLKLRTHFIRLFATLQPEYNITGLQINLYLEQPMEIQLFATFFQRRK
jgi:hypothetical protein